LTPVGFPLSRYSHRAPIEGRSHLAQRAQPLVQREGYHLCSDRALLVQREGSALLQREGSAFVQREGYQLVQR
jgi:hypothetical protein